VYLCVLCGSQNEQRLFSYTALTDWFVKREGVCLLRGTDGLFSYTALTDCFVKREGVCLLRGTDGVFKSDRYGSVLKGLYASLLEKAHVR